MLDLRANWSCAVCGALTEASVDAGQQSVSAAIAGPRALSFGPQRQKAQPARAPTTQRTRGHSSRNMSHKVIDLASDEEKEKAGPIDLANSSDDDVEDREDLQVACPKCTLLNAGDADQCVA